MKTIALIQARMTSTRLPGKTLMEIAGKSLLRHVYDRVRGAERLDDVVVCTSREMSDAPIAAACRADNIPVFRGSETDVLGRLADDLNPTNYTAKPLKINLTLKGVLDLQLFI